MDGFMKIDFCFLKTLLFLACLSSCTFASQLDLFKHVKVLNSNSFKELKSSPAVSVVYFYTQDVYLLPTYFKEFEASARYLEAYNVNIGVFDCLSDSTEEKCKEEDVNRHVYTYQRGIQLIQLELETMFDVNSVMSNALQLVLLQEVPIVDSRLERQDLQKVCIGKKDLIFAYPEAVGTQEHRIFMEIAYTFQDDFKFALTTEIKATQGLQNSGSLVSSTPFAMWVLFCSEGEPEKPAEKGNCLSVLYKGKVTLSAVADFMKRLHKKSVFYAPDEETDELLKNSDVPSVFFYINEENKQKVEDMVKHFQYVVKGFANIIVVDMDNEANKVLAEEHGFTESIPSVAVKQLSGNITFMDSPLEWTVANIDQFLMEILFSFYSDVNTKIPERDSETDFENDLSTLINEVESQDDQVAKAVEKLQSTEMDLEFVPEFLKATFYEAIKSVELKMVLFYLPFDSMSMAFLRDFGSASRTLAENLDSTNSLARVNCFDATDLCALENITTYPHVRIYEQDGKSEKYLGPLDAASVVRTVQLIQLNKNVKLTSEDQVEEFTKGLFPISFQQFTPSSVLFLVNKNNKDDMNIVKSAQKLVSTVTAVALLEDDIVNVISKKYELPVPSVVSFNREDTIHAKKVLSELTSYENVVSFVAQSVIPTMPKLTAKNFPALFKRKLPFVILFIDPSDSSFAEAKAELSKVADRNEFINFTFSWINAETKSLGLKLLSEYTWTASLPMVTVVDHKKGCTFNYQPNDKLHAEKFQEWLHLVASGQENPSKSLQNDTWRAPGKHYDFLAMIDRDRNRVKDTSYNFDDDEYESLEAGDISQLPPHEQPQSQLQENDDIREELLKLRQSRLYQQSPDRVEALRKRQEKEAGKDEKDVETKPHIMHHGEL